MTTHLAVHAKVQDIFRDVLQIPDLVLTNELQAKDVENWDSVNNIVLVMELEESFGIKFTIVELAGMDNVGDLFDCLAQKGVR